MPELTYHKRIVKQRNILQTKERYKDKRSRREAKENSHPPEPLSWIARQKLKMQMNPKDYRDYLETQKRKGFKKTAIPDHELVPAIKKELVTPVKYNWFEKFLLWVKNLFNK